MMGHRNFDAPSLSSAICWYIFRCSGSLSPLWELLTDIFPSSSSNEMSPVGSIINKPRSRLKASIQSVFLLKPFSVCLGYSFQPIIEHISDLYLCRHVSDAIMLDKTAICRIFSILSRHLLSLQERARTAQIVVHFSILNIPHCLLMVLKLWSHISFEYPECRHS